MMMFLLTEMCFYWPQKEDLKLRHNSLRNRELQN